MKLYWSINSIPELADLPKEKRKEVWRECCLKNRRNWRVLIIGVAICGIFGGIGSVIEKGPIGAMIASTVGVFIVWQIEAAAIRHHIREYLNSHGKVG